MSQETLLEVRNLKTYFHTANGVLKAVDDVSFHVDRGETLGFVGESGCGKSVSCLSILQLVQPPGRYEDGQIIFAGQGDILKLDKHSLRELRGSRIAMIFQEPMAALNPVYTIGNSEMFSLRQRIRELKKELNHLYTEARNFFRAKKLAPQKVKAFFDGLFQQVKEEQLERKRNRNMRNGGRDAR